MLKNEELLRTGTIETPLKHYTAGALGCALSHKAVWEYCVAQDTILTLCEDDALLNRHFPEKAAAVLAQLPRDWDIVLWGWNFDSVLDVEALEGLKRTVMNFDPAKLARKAAEFQDKCYDVMPLRLLTAFGLVCYSLSPKGAQALIRRCFPLRNETIAIPAMRRQLVNFGIDVLMNKHHGGLKSYACFPPLVWTENDKTTSDIGDAGVPARP